MLALHMISFVLGAHHPFDSGEMLLVGLAVAIGLLKAVTLSIGYLALEPMARRRWPNTLISWTRLLDGRWKDPLVGRDVLAGIAAAVLAAFLIYTQQTLDRAAGGGSLTLPSQANLQDWQTMLASHVNDTGYSVLSTLATFLALVLIRLVVRRDWLAVVAAGLLFALPGGFTATTFASGFALGFAVNTLAFGLAARGGLTALVSFFIVLNVAMDAPATLDTSYWYVRHAAVIYVGVAVVTFFSLRNALAGRPLIPQTGN
jgi:hypothetical protein